MLLMLFSYYLVTVDGVSSQEYYSAQHSLHSENSLKTSQHLTNFYFLRQALSMLSRLVLNSLCGTGLP